MCSVRAFACSSVMANSSVAQLLNDLATEVGLFEAVAIDGMPMASQFCALVPQTAAIPHPAMDVEPPMECDVVMEPAITTDMVPIAATPMADIVIDDDVEVPSVPVNADVNVAGDPIAQDELQVAAMPTAMMEELARELGLYELAAAQGMPMTASLGGGASNLLPVVAWSFHKTPRPVRCSSS